MTANQTTKGWTQRLAARGTLALAPLFLLHAAGCDPLNAAALDDALLSDDVHPRTLFDRAVRSELAKSCSCHAVEQGSVKAFLAPGMEYDSITSYKGGAFLTPMAVSSLLLQKGQHVGPPFMPAQYRLVQSWLEAEAAYRPGNGSDEKTAILPTIPIADGDFNMSLQDLDPIRDPQANVTLTLKRAGADIYQVSKIKIKAGPTTGVRLVHPLFYFLTFQGSYADPADPFAKVDMTVPADGEAVIGSGGAILTNKPQTQISRLGLAFKKVEKANPVSMDIACKAFDKFNPAVKNELVSCAQTCHAPGRNNTANGAFNMVDATSGDTAVLKQFCISTLGRIDKKMPENSILIKQITPQNLGGTPNHPLKIMDNAARMRFTTAVQTWAAGEK